MEHILTLIGNPQKPFDRSAADGAHGLLQELGASPKPVDWLNPAVAADIACDVAPERAADMLAAARQRLDGAPVDVAVQPAAGRRKALLVADMESTIIQNEMLDELADYVGLKAEVADITTRAMNGELDFAAAVRERVGLLKGLPASVLDDSMQRVRIMPGAPELIGTMRANGAYCALVSGGFGFFTRKVRERLGFDYDQANEIDVADGQLAGTVREPILDKNSKLAALERLAGERKVALAAAVTVGDGANDLPMLQAAGLGVAYHAKPTVAAAVKVRIDHGDLTALLYLQGYRASDFRA
ncbi:MAG TPA: phosphoserine phosphatase SerB [Alphaproteobacteria bacterium]|jgi:phosphoserine phosphatase